MTSQREFDVASVLGALKDFQRSTAEWVFERMFDEEDPALRFLVADEVGLGKTHVARGVVAQVLEYLGSAGDERHDIVYVCSNGAIARQNLRKLVPAEFETDATADRLSMLPLLAARKHADDSAKVNVYPITPGTSFDLGRQTGKFRERVLVYAFLHELWGADAMQSARARWIYWAGITGDDADERLRRAAVDTGSAEAAAKYVRDFANEVAIIDAERHRHGREPLRALHDRLVAGLWYKRAIPEELKGARKELIGGARQALATLGVTLLQPDLVIMDEFQRFKHLLAPDADDWASMLARRLMEHRDTATGRATRTLLLSATPYRMYSRDADSDDHFSDFIATCGFLLGDEVATHRLEQAFRSLRGALTSPGGEGEARKYCGDIEDILRRVMSRTERLGVTPDRDGMLVEHVHESVVTDADLTSYIRQGDIAQVVGDHEPVEYWKSTPYLFNFMDSYQLKRRFRDALEAGSVPAELLKTGPGLLDWDRIRSYGDVDPENGRLRWLLDDLAEHRAFELVWLPPSLPYYDAASVYDSPEAKRFTKRLVFSAWGVVPKAVASFVTWQAERNIYAGVRKCQTTSTANARGAGRLRYRRNRTGGGAGAMNNFIAVWPSIALARLGDPRPVGTSTPTLAALRASVARSIEHELRPFMTASASAQFDPRWYWAAPLLLDRAADRSALFEWFSRVDVENDWAEHESGTVFASHLDLAWRFLNDEEQPLGRAPDDLVEVLTDLAVGGPATCALRAMASVSGLAERSPEMLGAAARIGAGMRRLFDEPEVNAIVLRSARAGREAGEAEEQERYWLDAVRHCVAGNLQSVLDEHTHVLRDWLGFVDLADGSASEEDRAEAVAAIAERIVTALGVRAVPFAVDVPGKTAAGPGLEDGTHLRAKFAAALGQRAADDKGIERTDAVSVAYNSPFWPFVLVSTSIGQEGLDFHLWSHAVVHWNLPSNPVDLEQREGRVHRFKGHAVRRNLAATLDPTWAPEPGGDLWESVFQWAVARRAADQSDLVPFWVYPEGPARIERHVPLPPFSRDAAALPRLRRSLAAYRLAFGQPRQEDLVAYLAANHSDEEVEALLEELRIDLTPPRAGLGSDSRA